MRYLILLTVVLTYPMAAHATLCDARIARAEVQLRDAQPSIWLPESTDAKLHHQPTEQTLRAAESESRDELKAAIARARQLNSEGKDSECVAMLDRFLLSGDR